MNKRDYKITPKESNKIRDKAIKKCIEIDRKSGITSRNRDCLD